MQMPQELLYQKGKTLIASRSPLPYIAALSHFSHNLILSNKSIANATTRVSNAAGAVVA